jgi:hypothetical protein
MLELSGLCAPAMPCCAATCTCTAAVARRRGAVGMTASRLCCWGPWCSLHGWQPVSWPRCRCWTCWRAWCWLRSCWLPSFQPGVAEGAAGRSAEPALGALMGRRNGGTATVRALPVAARYTKAACTCSRGACPTAVGAGALLATQAGSSPPARPHPAPLDDCPGQAPRPCPVGEAADEEWS